METEKSNILYANKRGIVLALTLATFLAAMDTTIVTMATPTITKDLNGFELISLIFSIYLLTSSIATPIFEKWLFRCQTPGCHTYSIHRLLGSLGVSIISVHTNTANDLP